MSRYIDGRSINKWNNAEYAANHNRVRKAKGKASDYPCVDCSKDARDWAHIHDKPKGDVNSYQPMCRLCHQAYDRAEWLIEERRRERARIENTAAFKGWTPERREAQRQRMLAKWNKPGERARQAKRCKRDKPWTGRRPKDMG